MNDCQVTVTQDGSLKVRTPYSRYWVSDLKRQVPWLSRRWDPEDKVWLVDPAYAQQVRNLIGGIYSERITMPRLPGAVEETVQLHKLEYVGMAKKRDDGDAYALGWANGGWFLAFPEDVIRKFFSDTDNGGNDNVPPADVAAMTFYALLGAKRNVDAAALKSAYRRMARQWHPDVCKEPGATERFQLINQAYEVLKDSGKRARYDAGLALEQEMKRQQERLKKHSGDLGSFARMPVRKSSTGWRPPLRCGWLAIQQKRIVGRHVVSAILQWNDITDAHGRTLVTSWPPGLDHFVRKWVK